VNRTKTSPKRRGLRAVAALSILALTASACGGDDDAEAVAAAAPADESTADSEPAAEPASESTEEPASEPASEPTEEPAAEPTEEPAAEGDYDRTGWPDKLTFAIVPAENADNFSSYVTPDILGDELGIEFEIVEAADYAGVIEGMIAERVDVGAFGAFAYVIATGNGADIDLAGIWSGPTAETYGDYRSYLVVPVGSEIREPADLAGKTVCFVDPGSTSGFLFPSAALLEVGLNPNEDSTDINPVFAGGHDAAPIAVKNGDCDAGFAYDTMITSQLIDSGDLAGVIDSAEDGLDDVNPEQADLDIIWKSTAIAAPPLGVGNWLPDSLKQAISDVATSKVNIDYAAANGYCEAADESCELADGFFWGFLPETDAYFDGIRDLCELTGSSKCSLDG